jgi:hypothetical protein
VPIIVPEFEWRGLTSFEFESGTPKSWDLAQYLVNTERPYWPVNLAILRASHDLTNYMRIDGSNLVYDGVPVPGTPFTGEIVLSAAFMEHTTRLYDIDGNEWELVGVDRAAGLPGFVFVNQRVYCDPEGGPYMADEIKLVDGVVEAVLYSAEELPLAA